MPRSNRDMVAWCLMILWPKPFRFHDFFAWNGETHIVEKSTKSTSPHSAEKPTKSIAFRKLKPFSPSLRNDMNQRYSADTFYALWLCTGCRLVSPNGRNVAMKWLWLPGPRMKSMDEHALHGFRGILLQSWSWCACQPWRSVSNEGSVSHENMCRNWEGTWNMVRNLDAELTLEKKFRFFLPVHIAGFPPFKKFRVYPFIREGNKHRGVEVRQSRWSHHGNLHLRHANSTAERWRVQVDPVLHGGSGLAFGVHGGLVMHNEWRRNAP